MSAWREKEWRMPLKGELVKDPEGNVGIITRTTGTISKKRVWVNDVHDIEIYTDAPSEYFTIVDVEELKKFQLERLSLKYNIQVGSICYLRADFNNPLEIIHLEWNDLYQRPFIYTKDVKLFEDNIIKITDMSYLTLFDLNMPPIEHFFSNENSQLKWRLDVNLVEKESAGWGVNGNEWRFSSKESAMKEYDNWSARLKIRRYSSIINTDWKIAFPCWVIDMNFDYQLRVREIDFCTGFPAYFKTASHAAYALKHIPPDLWKKAYDTSIDVMFQ